VCLTATAVALVAAKFRLRMEQTVSGSALPAKAAPTDPRPPGKVQRDLQPTPSQALFGQNKVFPA
jgi:hypothetical protein